MLTKNSLTLSPIFIALLFNTGCTQKQCDPKRGGFIAGIACQQAYGKRIDNLTLSLQRQSTKTHYLLAQNNRLIAQLTQDKSSLNQLQEEIRVLGIEVGSIEQLVQKIKKRHLPHDIGVLDKKLRRLSLDVFFTKKLTTISVQKYTKAKRILTQRKMKPSYMKKNPHLKKFDTLHFKQLKEITRKAHQDTDMLSQNINRSREDLHSTGIDMSRIENILLDAKYFIKSYKVTS